MAKTLQLSFFSVDQSADRCYSHMVPRVSGNAPIVRFDATGGEKPGDFRSNPLHFSGRRKFALYLDITKREPQVRVQLIGEHMICGPSITSLRHPPPWMGYAGRNSETELGRPEIGIRPGHRRLFSSGCKGFYRREAGISSHYGCRVHPRLCAQRIGEAIFPVCA